MAFSSWGRCVISYKTGRSGEAFKQIPVRPMLFHVGLGTQTKVLENSQK